MIFLKKRQKKGLKFRLEKDLEKKMNLKLMNIRKDLVMK